MSFWWNACHLLFSPYFQTPPIPSSSSVSVKEYKAKMEDSHKCRLCSRSFINGRALGGHMKAHLATFSIEHQNLNKTFKSSDPDIFSVNGVQDTESETESKNPNRRRSKRTRRFHSDSSPEPASSISDASTEEDVAICLVMLSMEKPPSGNGGIGKGKDRSWTPESEKSTAAVVVKVGRSFRCGKCRKSFRSNRALFGHRKVCRKEGEEEDEGIINGANWKIFKCPYCCKVFGSGQALGGHKRSHLQGSIRTAIDGSSSKLEIGLDLNLPAPMEEDDYSVVSDL